MIKYLITALFLISCSDSDKFNANSEPGFEIRISYGTYITYNPYIYARANITQKDNAEYYYCYWTIDGNRFYGQDVEQKVSYGEHILRFVLVDNFNDTLSESRTIRINEPLKITLLSPIDNYEAAKTDTIEFQYKISGIDTWEGDPKTVVYISTDEKRWTPLRGNFLAPPLNEQIYYWRVRSFNEQDTVLSEIRSVWIKN